MISPALFIVAIPCSPIIALTDADAGESVQSKIASLREKLTQKGCNAIVLTALDDICWLLNIRGDDVQFNPVVYGYVLVTMDAVHLFIHEGREVRAAGVGLQLHPYAEFLPFLETVARDASVKLCYDENDVSFAVKQVLAPLKPAVVFEWALCAGLTRSPVAVMKSRKNPTEIASLEEAFLADSVAMCHLLAWLADSVDSHITEADAAAKSTELRRALAHSLSDSFAPIVGCAGNAAIVHYEPEPATAAPLVRDKCILLDTGGQYHWGTTDITRTVCLPSDPALSRVDMAFRRCYTAVLKGHIGLMTAVFPEGTRGVQLDLLARQHLWQMGLDFGHGTGHGVGCCLCVHEGPEVGARGRSEA